MVKSNVLNTVRIFARMSNLLKHQICNAPFPVFFFAWLRKQSARTQKRLAATIKQTVNAICILHE
jgi:hypothetical protein